MEADPGAERCHEQPDPDLDPDADPAMMEQKLDRPQPSQAEGEDEAGETGEGGRRYAPSGLPLPNTTLLAW